MNIISISAECAPFAKIGGLADVVGALPKDWERLGHNVVVVLPKYRDIETDKHNIVPTDIVVSVPMGSWVEYSRLWYGTIPGTKVPVYFLESYDYFERKGIYGNPDGFLDNDRRFVFLSRAVFEVAKTIGFKPDILHTHDYHTALANAFLKTHYKFDPHFSKTASVLTIHNMAYQGQSDPRKVLELCGFSYRNFRGSWFEHDGVLNMMKAGLMFADKVNAVSPTYAAEIRFSKLGEGMQDYANQRAGDFLGILNGADYTEWNPKIDTLISANYSSAELEKKKQNKQFLLEKYIPEYDRMEDIPLIGMVSRLTNQKGISIIMDCMEELVKSGKVRFAILGSGEKRYEVFFRQMGSKYPTRVINLSGYNNQLSHQIIAGSDMLMVPSLFEPCGLTQIYAMKYGTVPIARLTGGLADTVQEFSPLNKQGVGFTFEKYSGYELLLAVSRAVHYYSDSSMWTTIQQNCMNRNFSSELAAINYINMFHWALEKVQ